MAALNVQSVAQAGLAVTFGAAGAGGDTFQNSGRTFLHVKNAGGGAVTVTVDSTRRCDQGFDHDVVVSVPAGSERLIGPFPTDRFGRTASVTYSGVTSVTVAAVQLPA